MNQTAPIDKLAHSVAAALIQAQGQLVLAESCTAGLAAATLGRVPGISRHFCGSAVVYQEPTKSAWLQVPTKSLADYGAVSAQVATAMAAGALESTPHSNLAVAVTGHLGPDAPPELDGVVYIASQRRGKPCHVKQFRLPPCETQSADEKSAMRKERQEAATRLVFEQVLDAIAAN